MWRKPAMLLSWRNDIILLLCNVILFKKTHNVDFWRIHKMFLCWWENRLLYFFYETHNTCTFDKKNQQHFTFDKAHSGPLCIKSHSGPLLTKSHSGPFSTKAYSCPLSRKNKQWSTFYKSRKWSTLYKCTQWSSFFKSRTLFIPNVRT